MMNYELRCRECGKSWGNQPRSICDDCFSPLEVAYDYEALRGQFHPRENRPGSGQHVALLGAAAAARRIMSPRVPAGFTPLVKAPRLAHALGREESLCEKRRRLPAHAQLQGPRGGGGAGQGAQFGFDTVGCSSTGNLANAVAAQAARNGFKSCIFIPADLEPAKIVNTQVYGAQAGAHRRQLRSSEPPLLADRRRTSLGLREREPAPLLRRGIEDRRIRNCRATRLAPAGQRCRVPWPADR